MKDNLSGGIFIKDSTESINSENPMTQVMSASIYGKTNDQIKAIMPDFKDFINAISQTTSPKTLLSLAMSSADQINLVFANTFMQLEQFHSEVVDLDDHLGIAEDVKEKIIGSGNLKCAGQAADIEKSLKPAVTAIDKICAVCYAEVSDSNNKSGRINNYSMVKIIWNVNFHLSLIDPATNASVINPDNRNQKYNNLPIDYYRNYAKQVFLFAFDMNQLADKVNSQIIDGKTQIAAANVLLNKLFDVDDQCFGAKSYRNVHKEVIAQVKDLASDKQAYNDACQNNYRALLQAADKSCIPSLLKNDVTNMYSSGCNMSSIPSSEAIINDDDNVLLVLKKRSDNLLYKIFYEKFPDGKSISQDDANAIVAFSGDKVTEKDIAAATGNVLPDDKKVEITVINPNPINLSPLIPQADSNKALNDQITVLDQKAKDAQALLDKQTAELKKQLADNAAKSDADKKLLADQLAAKSQEIADSNKKIADLVQKQKDADLAKQNADALDLANKKIADLVQKQKDADLAKQNADAIDLAKKNADLMIDKDVDASYLIHQMADKKAKEDAALKAKEDAALAAQKPRFGMSKTTLAIGGLVLGTVAIVAIARSSHHH